MNQPRIIIAGETDLPVFQPAVAWLRARFVLSDSSTDASHSATELFNQAKGRAKLLLSRESQIDVPSTSRLGGSLAPPDTTLAESKAPLGPTPPQAIIFVHSRPEVISAAEISQARKAFPQAQLLSFAGPWCDGELRLNILPADLLRVRWDRWQAEFPLILQPRSVLPKTKSELDRILGRRRSPVRSGNPFVAIISPLRSQREMFADLIQQLGWQPIILDSPAEIAEQRCAAVIAGLPCSAANLLHYQTLARHTAVLAALHFARPEEVEQLQAIGVTAVIDQPWNWANWEHALTSVLSGVSPQSQAA